MDDELVFTGRIVSGVRKAAFFTQLDWVQNQCLEKLGFRPYPGTLNLEINQDDLPVIENLQKMDTEELIPADPNFCTAKVLTVSLGSARGAIIIPAEDVQVHGKNIVEIIAPIRIKEALKVNDGDSVTVIITEDHLQKGFKGSRIQGFE